MRVKMQSLVKYVPVLALFSVVLGGCASNPSTNIVDSAMGSNEPQKEYLKGFFCKGTIGVGGSGHFAAFASAENAWNVNGNCGDGFYLGPINEEILRILNNKAE